MRFEKGIKKIETDIPNQAVTITYDADKTNVEAIIKGFKKINYEATVKQDCAEKASCCGKMENCTGTQKSCTTAEKSCCGSK